MLKKYSDKLIGLKYFEELYCLSLMAITLIGWKFNEIVGISLLILAATAVLLLLQDLKYILPNILFLIFNLNKGFSNTQFPIPIIVLASLFIIILVIHIIKTGVNFKKMKSATGLIGLAVINFIPIFWNKIPPENAVFYFFYFASFGYLLLYCIAVNGIKSDSIKIISVAMSWLAVLLFAECGLKVLELHQNKPDADILSFWYYLGWGLCNEAGILICLSFAFVFYLISQSENIWEMLLQFLKLICGFIGIILTTSRGAFLFGLGITGLCAMILCFCCKRQKLYDWIFYTTCFALVILAIIFKDSVIEFCSKYYHLVFNNLLDDNGRKELWQEALHITGSSPLYIIFGPGITCSIRELATAQGWQIGVVVFHSTFFETLAMGGILGVIFLIWHLIQKYKNILSAGNKQFKILITVGFVLVGIYGMIDNTYYMYYYMIPLTLIMASIDNAIYFKRNDATHSEKNISA